MSKTIITYESQHGTAKKIAEIVASKLDCEFINVDTPFQAEDLSEIDNLILVFNFRGPYTAQLTKLFLNRIKDQLKNKNVFLIGEGIFSEKEFPVVAEEIRKIANPRNFNKYFIKGQLRTGILFPEEKALLKKFGEITKMQIVDMGEFEPATAETVATEIAEFIKTDVVPVATNEKEQTKWVCPLCGYVHTGENPPEACPLCGAPGSTFIKQE